MPNDNSANNTHSESNRTTEKNFTEDLASELQKKLDKYPLLKIVLEQLQQENIIHAVTAVAPLPELEKLVKKNKHLVNRSIEKGYTPLHIAAYMGNVEAVEFLLANGAHIDNTPLLGNVALFCAILGGSFALVEKLLRMGSDAANVDPKKQTPLWLALKIDRKDIAELLIRYGAHPDDNREPEGRRTLLQKALEDGDEKLADFLLDNGASPDFRTPQKWKSLHVLARSSLRSPQLVEKLFKKSMDSAYFFTTKTPQKESVFHVAAQYGNTAIIREILKMAPPFFNKFIYKPDSLGNTPFHYAVRNKDIESLQVLLSVPFPDRNALINHPNPKGNTALLKAVKENWPAGVELLLKNGADTSIRDNDGKLPLEIAAESAEKDAIKITMIFLEKRYGYLISDTSKMGFFPTPPAEQQELPGGEYKNSAASDRLRKFSSCV